MREGISVRCQRRRFGEQPAEEGFFSLLGGREGPRDPPKMLQLHLGKRCLNGRSF